VTERVKAARLVVQLVDEFIRTVRLQLDICSKTVKQRIKHHRNNLQRVFQVKDKLKRGN